MRSELEAAEWERRRAVIAAQRAEVARAKRERQQEQLQARVRARLSEHQELQARSKEQLEERHVQAVRVRAELEVKLGPALKARSLRKVLMLLGEEVKADAKGKGSKAVLKEALRRALKKAKVKLGRIGSSEMFCGIEGW
jgi:hypothetical protein